MFVGHESVSIERQEFEEQLFDVIKWIELETSQVF